MQGEVQKAITEASSGRALIEKEKELYYAKIEGEIVLFDH
jgi:hypothetical protein